MTTITANFEFNQNKFDLSFMKSGLKSFELLKASALDPHALPTQDSLVAHVSRGGTDYTEMFIGKDLTISSQAPNDVSFTDGIVTAFADFAVDGQSCIQTVAFEGFNILASAFSNAIETTSTVDDTLIMKRMLSGNDVFALSQFNDYANGYGGSDKLFGQEGNDTLDGDAGADRLFGGGGNDSLTGGSGADLLDGGLAEDVVLAGDGDDTLINGLGDDTLAGGVGADVFMFSTRMGVDHITDFTSASDQISFSKKIFAAIGNVGTISSTAFYAAQGAQSGHLATDRVIYNTSTGALYYDADGSGSRAAVQIAILDGHPTLAYTDLLVF